MRGERAGEWASKCASRRAGKRAGTQVSVRVDRRAGQQSSQRARKHAGKRLSGPCGQAVLLSGLHACDSVSVPCGIGFCGPDCGIKAHAIYNAKCWQMSPPTGWFLFHILELLNQRPCGLMDKALVFGAKDCRFESCQGHFNLPCHHNTHHNTPTCTHTFWSNAC